MRCAHGPIEKHRNGMISRSHLCSDKLMFYGEPHLHLEKTAMEQALCLLQLVQLLRRGRPVKVAPGHLHWTDEPFLTACSGLGPFGLRGPLILIFLLAIGRI